VTKLNTDLRMLSFDIECSPALSWHYGMRDQNISISSVVQEPRMIAFSAKWYGKKPIIFRSEFHHSRQEMLEEIRALLDESDVVIGWNSRRFDTKWVNWELEVEGVGVPSPYKQIDLMTEVKKNFRSLSYKLDYISKRLLDEQKIDYSMMRMWETVSNPETDEKTRKKEWDAMRKYAIRDTALLEPLFERLLPWIKMPHPASSLTGLRCRKCGSENLRPNGSTLTAEGRYRKYLCENCGGHTRGTKREAIGETREIS